MCAAKKLRNPLGKVLALEQHNVLNDSGDVTVGWSSQQDACVSMKGVDGRKKVGAAFFLWLLPRFMCK